MKPRLVWLGLAAFMLALIIVLPSRWVAGLLPAQLHCANWSGSVWRGQCAMLTLQQPGAAPLQVELLRWKLQPAALLRLSLQAAVEMQTPMGAGSGQLELRRGGRLALLDVTATAVFDRRLYATLPPGWTGRLDAQHLTVRVEGTRLLALSGELTLLDFNDGMGSQFGSYRLVFPPAAAPPFAGALQDTGGPLAVTASLTINADRRWLLNGTIAARPAAGLALRKRLDILGAPDANGRYPLSIEGSFK
ncbi:MAG: type II secretion system protein N [Steroidobacteraceae bacterium]